MQVCKYLKHTRIFRMNSFEIAQRVKRFLEDNQMSEKALAEHTNTDQTQISRIKNGKFTKITDNVKRVCEYANIDINEETSPADNAELMDALSLVWDRTDQQAKALANVIRSLKELA